MIIGCFVGALAIAPVLEILYHAYGFTGALPRPDMDSAIEALSAPQATLMTTIFTRYFHRPFRMGPTFNWWYLGIVLIIVDAFIV